MPMVAFLFSRLCSVLGMQILACTFVFRLFENGIDVYGLSQLGLAATLASLTMSFPIGYIVDHISKKKAILVSNTLLFILCLIIAKRNSYAYGEIVLFTALLAITRNFRSISQFTVFGELLKSKQKKDTWVNLSTLAWQIAAFAAPLIAGVLGSKQSTLIMATVCIGAALAAQFYISRALNEDKPKSTSSQDRAGTTAKGKSSIAVVIGFLSENFKLSSSLILDFVIVLFAGSASLLPFLHTPEITTTELGFLKSALPAGIIFGTFIRLKKKAAENWAEKLFLATMGYGLCHLFLSESPNLKMSFLLLFGAGIFDALSLTIRECILQLETPPHLKGRIYSLNNFLVNASDELSEWESGLTAHWLGVRLAIKLSGVIAVVSASYFLYRSKKQDLFEEKAPLF